MPPYPEAGDCFQSRVNDVVELGLDKWVGESWADRARKDRDIKQWDWGMECNRNGSK